MAASVVKTGEKTPSMIRATLLCGRVLSVSVATAAEPRGEKKLFFVQILGGEKLLKFVEKCQ